jgi:hypothetical protein
MALCTAATVAASAGAAVGTAGAVLVGALDAGVVVEEGVVVAAGGDVVAVLEPPLLHAASSIDTAAAVMNERCKSSPNSMPNQVGVPAGHSVTGDPRPTDC